MPVKQYAYNAHGSMTAMPHLQNMQWDFAERLSHITRGTTKAYYNYDGSGQRIRKIVEKGNIMEERSYLGGFEIWRKHVNGTLDTERETLHIMDDVKRIAVVETKTVDNGTAVDNPAPIQRYQLGNNIESAALELDESANIISYEEYYPYGETSYRAGRNASEASQKRYRYTGKEKDEESGLYYYGARYYACWLGRWTAADPTGLVDGLNLYMYCRGSPVGMVDPNGTRVDEGKKIDIDTVDVIGKSEYDIVNNGTDTLGYIYGCAEGSISLNSNSFIQELKENMSDNGMEVEWLEETKRINISIEIGNNLKINHEKLVNSILAVATTDNKVLINLNNEFFKGKDEIDNRELQAIVLHELVHIWQNNTDWRDKVTNSKANREIPTEDGGRAIERNVFTEVEAYNIQFEFEEKMKVEVSAQQIDKIREAFKYREKNNHSDQLAAEKNKATFLLNVVYDKNKNRNFVYPSLGRFKEGTQ
jgi:RHS repeat-associated protein